MDNYNWKKNMNTPRQEERFHNFSISRPPHRENNWSNFNRNQSSARGYYHNSRRDFRGRYNNTNRDFRRNNTFPYRRPQSDSFRDRRANEYTMDRHQNHYEEDIVIPKSPLDMKIERLISEVKSQSGINGQIVFMQSPQESENFINLLTNAVLSTNFVLKMTINDETNMYELKVNNEKLAETKNIGGKKVLKSPLYEIACKDLKRKCFYITSKQNFEEVTTGADSTEQTLKKDTATQPTNSMEGSKAYLMMLKMGWSGKGLGVNEQGEEKTVAEKMTRNITKEGLGSGNVMAEVENILNDFAHSTKVTTLIFDSSFTKEERASIHQIAQKLCLKSKSIGKDDNRRITISKKIEKWDLVKTLLREDGLENDSYKLLIPEDFKHLWED